MNIVKAVLMGLGALTVGWIIGALAFVVTMGHMFKNVPLEPSEHIYDDLIGHHQRWRSLPDAHDNWEN